jgi:hypothetical protein
VAVARIFTSAPGGILPFGLASGAGGGEHLCLSDAPPGLADNPCEGGVTGNFGVIKARIYGVAPFIAQPCNAAPIGDVLAFNIARGIDHTVVQDPDGLVSNEVRDSCYNPFVDTLNTDTGWPNNGTQEGLVGPVPGGFTPRLELSTNLATIVNGEQVDDTPPWSYLLPAANGSDGNPDYGGASTPDTGDDAPASCDPAEFTGGGPMDWNIDGIPDDYNEDGIPDQRGTWQHFAICLRQYVGDVDFDGTGGGTEYSAVIIDPDILDNEARFAYVPQFWESSLGNGNDWLHIQRFRAVYLQSTGWKKGNDYIFQHPGEGCTGCDSGWSMISLSAFTFPDDALPIELRGDPLPGGAGDEINPFQTELYR